MAHPYRYRIDRGVAIIEAFGDQTLEAIVEVNARLFADPKFSADMPKIYDNRRQTSYIGTKDMVRLRDELFRLNPPRGAKRKLGIVASDAMVELIVKLYSDLYHLESQAGSLEARVFKTLQEAEAWARGEAAAPSVSRQGEFHLTSPSAAMS